jgi:hypothetical protein
MANKIEIDVIANDLASAALDLVKSKLNVLGSTAGMVAGVAVTMGAALVTGLSKAKDAAFAYDQQIYELMLRTGGTAEETSRLVQTLDDAGIEFGTVETAMKFAVKNGIEPNIQSLAALSDEYLKLAPGVERGQFLLDKFGRSGMDMARAMDLGGASILRMSGNIEEGLVLTQQAVVEGEKYRKNVDKIKDSWDSWVITVGNKVLPAINDTIAGWDTLNRGAEQNIRLMEEARAVTGTTWEQYQLLGNAARDAAESTARLNLSIADGNSDAVRRVSTSQSMLDMYAVEGTSAAEAAAATDAANKEIKSSLLGVITMTGQLSGASAEAANAYVFNMMMAKAAAGDFGQAQFDMMMKIGVAMGQFDEKTAKASSQIKAMSDAVLKGTGNVEALKLAIQRLEGKDIMITANMSGNAFSGFVTPGQGTNAVVKKEKVWKPPDDRGAVGTGGWKTVPPGYPNDSYTVAVTSGETYAVMTRSQSMGASGGGGGGGGTVINLTYAPAFSMADKSEFQNKLMPFIIQGIRESKRQ